MAVATKTEAPKTDGPVRMGQRVPSEPVIKSTAIRWQTQNGNAGHVWNEAFVTLPPEIKNVQALQDAPGSLWRNLMSAPATALRKRDMIYFESADGTWAAEARVAYADRTRVVLYGWRHYAIPVIESGLFEDENFRVVADQGYYVVERKLDGVRMGDGFGSPEQAKMALLNQYPTRAA